MQTLKEQAENVNQAICLALSGIAQDMRNPISGVLGYAELLSGTGLDPVQNDYVRYLHRSGSLLLSYIEEIQDISTIETQKLKLDQIDFELEHLLQSVTRHVNLKLRNKSTWVAYEMKEMTPSRFSGDPTRIRQILFNIIGNVLISSPDGEICIETQLIKPEIYEHTGKKSNFENSHRLMFTVKFHQQIPDSECLEKSDFNTTLLARKLNLKLGYAKTQALIYKMNGEIDTIKDADNTSGYVFTIQLRDAEQVSSSDILPVSVESLKGRGVIIIESQDESRSIITGFCQNVGMSIAGEYTSAAEAMDSIQTLAVQPDLVIADINPAGLPGFELASEIKTLKPEWRVKLLGLSSDPQPGLAKRFQDHGFHAYLSKPVIDEELIQVIQTVLGDRRDHGQIITRHLARELIMKEVKILIAESNIVNRKLLNNLMNRLGIHPDITGNGPEVIEMIRLTEYDLVFITLDLQMMDPIETLQAINDIHPGLPVIAMTAKYPKNVSELESAGICDVIVRPVNLKTLREKIYRRLKRK